MLLKLSGFVRICADKDDLAEFCIFQGWIGTQGEYNFMVMDLLGPSLDAYFKHCNFGCLASQILYSNGSALNRVQWAAGVYSFSTVACHHECTPHVMKQAFLKSAEIKQI